MSKGSWWGGVTEEWLTDFAWIAISVVMMMCALGHFVWPTFELWFGGAQ